MFAVAVFPLALFSVCGPAARPAVAQLRHEQLRAAPISTPSRRQLLQLPATAVGAAAAAAFSGGGAAVAADARLPTELQLLGIKAKKLRAAVRIGASNRRKLPFDQTPGVNNYGSLTDRVKRDKASVLLPLQSAIGAYASGAALSDLELQKQLALQPLLMKGHLLELDQAITPPTPPHPHPTPSLRSTKRLLELDQALGEFRFNAYVSKTTGRTYPGGKASLRFVFLTTPCFDDACFDGTCLMRWCSSVTDSLTRTPHWFLQQMHHTLALVLPLVLDETMHITPPIHPIP